MPPTIILTAADSVPRLARPVKFCITADTPAGRAVAAARLAPQLPAGSTAQLAPPAREATLVAEAVAVAVRGKQLLPPMQCYRCFAYSVVAPWRDDQTRATEAPTPTKGAAADVNYGFKEPEHGCFVCAACFYADEAPGALEMPGRMHDADIDDLLHGGDEDTPGWKRLIADQSPACCVVMAAEAAVYVSAGATGVALRVTSPAGAPVAETIGPEVGPPSICMDAEGEPSLQRIQNLGDVLAARMLHVLRVEWPGREPVVVLGGRLAGLTPAANGPGWVWRDAPWDPAAAYPAEYSPAGRRRQCWLVPATAAETIRALAGPTVPAAAAVADAVEAAFAGTAWCLLGSCG